MIEKRFIYNKFDVVGDFESELKLYEIDNNPSNDLDESNLFYVYSNSEANIENIVDKLNALIDENEQLKEENNKIKSLLSQKIKELNDDYRKSAKAGMPTGGIIGELDSFEEICEEMGWFN